MKKRKKSIRNLFNQTMRLPPLSPEEERQMYQEINEQIEIRISEIRLVDASVNAKVQALIKLHNELKPMAMQLLWLNLMDRAAIQDTIGAYHPSDGNPFMIGVMDGEKVDKPRRQEEGPG